MLSIKLTSAFKQSALRPLGSGRLAPSIRAYSSKSPPKSDHDLLNDEKHPTPSKRRLNPMAAKSKTKSNESASVKSKSTSSRSKKAINAKTQVSNSASNLVNTKFNESTNFKQKLNYIPITKFPKVPDSILNQSAKDLYESIGLTPPEEEEMNKKKNTFVDFNIPDDHLKSTIKARITEKDRAIVDGLDNMVKSNDDREIRQLHASVVKLYYDEDTNTYQPLPEHTLKKSLSGMINLNPHLEDIDDEYLWDLFPRNKPFGNPPFEQKWNINSFKNWENSQLEKLRKEQSIKEDHKKEYSDFLNQLHDSKSLFKKTAANMNQQKESNASVNSKGRRKLDRKLLKQYKKLKEEGKIPKDDDDNDKF